MGRVAARAKELLDEMQTNLFRKAKEFRDANTFEVNSYQELKDKADDGFLWAHWCENPTCEAKIKAETQVTTRCRPFTLKQEKGNCIVCGNPSPGRIVFAKAY